MKRVMTFIIFLAFTISLSAAGLSSTSAQPALSKMRSTSKELSEEQIDELYTTFTDEKSGKSYRLSASFGAKNFSSREVSEKNKYKKSGKIPYRLTTTLYEVKTVKGKSFSKRLNGTVRFYIMDESGNVLTSKSSALSKMCPG